MKLRKYRIIEDGWLGYTCQVWRKWFPFWTPLGGFNSHFSVNAAKVYIEEHLRRKEHLLEETNGAKVVEQ